MRLTRPFFRTFSDIQNIHPQQWKTTLRLPESTFPARPTAAELQKYRKRCADDLYAWQSANRPDPGLDAGEEGTFVLHDGPPYANGAVHVGHALNKVLKDMICRFHLQRGRRVVYRPGWDCHGLPIELKALQRRQRNPQAARYTLDGGSKEEADAASGAGMSAVEIRKAARRLATATIEEQKASFRAWGVMGDWDGAYQTLDKDFEMRQLRVFREMVMKGLVFRQHRPVHWSPSSRTALAEAELEYDDNHKCTAAFIKFPLLRLPKVLQENSAIKPRSISALIWTTTPWTLPANKAVAVKNDMQYSVVELERNDNRPNEQLLIAQDRLKYILSHVPEVTTARVVFDGIQGADLADGSGIYYNVFSGETSPIVAADFVTATSGTGLVHLAPGHGMEDYQVCQQYDIETAFAPVDDEGRFTEHAFPADMHGRLLTGLDVQTDGVEAVLHVLKNPADRLKAADVLWDGGSLVMASHEFVHKNPIDWRTKQSVITRATAQWFADVSAIKERSLAALEEVSFVPVTGKARLRSFIEGRSQWCISRQRTWGVPIPALYDKATGDPVVTDESIDHIINTISERGTDAWFEDAPDDAAWIHANLPAAEYVRGKDTMDVWFDSGTTWTSLAQRDNLPPADVYVEGTDQHRGWFQSSLLTYVATSMDEGRPHAPFAALLTHGFALDEHGRKMSKSLGNVISPQQIMDGTLLSPHKAGTIRATLLSKKGSKGISVRDYKPAHDAMGPDALRLWVATSDWTKDVSISQPVLQSVHQALQKYRVTFKFLLGVIADYPANGPLTEEFLGDLLFADQIMLHQLSKRSKAINEAHSDYRFYKSVAEINNLVNIDLSAGWFEAIKDRLYAGPMSARLHTQTLCVMVLEELMQFLAPIVPHLIEEVWAHMPAHMHQNREPPLQRVHSGVFEFQLEDISAEDFERSVRIVRRVGDAVKAAQEQARSEGRLGNGLACRVEVQITKDCGAGVAEVLSKLESEMVELFVVSEAEVVLVNGTDEEKSEFNKRGLEWSRETIESQDGKVDLGIRRKMQKQREAELNADEERPEPVWRYEASFDVSDDGNQEKKIVGKVVVSPPLGEKCVRCWRYVAEERDVPCGRCQSVVQEAAKLEMAQEQGAEGEDEEDGTVNPIQTDTLRQKLTRLIVRTSK